MSFKKIGENLNFDPSNVKTAHEALANPEIAERFVKLAKQLKKIAPKANDFTYFEAIMMHAAEANLIDQTNGKPKLNTRGEPVKGHFETIKLSNGKESVKWVSEDGIKPYKNANGDIFGEKSLIEAHKKFVGKPLCRDHVSDSVDGIRGIIVDTYYDPKFKRVHALCALDKKNYADLAHKVETGYASSVSMGTAVGRSVCYECGNVATVEKEYCPHVKTRTCYGEINLDLNPIELSLVVTPADQLAKVKHIIASMNNYVSSKQASIEKMKSDRCVNPVALQELAASVSTLHSQLNELMGLEKKAEVNDLGEIAKMLEMYKDDPTKQDLVKALEERAEELVRDMPAVETPEASETARMTTGLGAGYEMQAPENEPTNISLDPSKRLASKEEDNQGALFEELGLLRSKLESMNTEINNLRTSISKEEKNMNSARLRARAKARRAYWLGGGGVNEPTPGKPKYEKEDYQSIRDKEDKQMVGEPLETGSEGMFPGDEALKKKLLRAEELEDRKLKREALLSEAQLEERRMQRRAYFQGGGGINEPAPGKVKYEKEDYQTIRDTEDKQMVGEPLETGKDGMMDGDLALKQKLLRAKLSAKLTKVADTKGNIVKGASKWDVYAGDKLILSATATEAFEDEVDANWDYFSSKDYGKDVMTSIRTAGFERTAWLLKGAAGEVATPELPPVAPATPAVEAPEAVHSEEKDGKMDEKVEAALNDMETKIAELRDLLSGSDDQLVEVDMAGKESAPMDQVLASKENLLKVEALLNESADELALVGEALEGLDKVEASVKNKIVKAASDALSDGTTILIEAGTVIEAAKKKKMKLKKKDEKKEDKDEKADKEEKKEKEAKAQELLDRALMVRAQNRVELLKKANEMCAEEMMALTPKVEDELQQLLKEEKKEKDSEGNLMHPDLDEAKADDTMEVSEGDENCGDEMGGAMMADEKQPVMCAHGPEEAHDEACAMDKEASVSARKVVRAKLVAEANQILGNYQLSLDKAENVSEPTYFLAHPGGKGTVTQLTSKTPEAKVETISEVHKVMREVAEKQPTNVREAAAELQESIVKGAFKAEDLDRLVAEGKADAATVEYWKKFFGQAPAAGSFGADLSKEFVANKKASDDKGYKIKLRRAYDVGLQAQEKGLIQATRVSLDTYVDEIMNFDDAAFESNKRVVANYKASKKSGALPRVGVDAAHQAIETFASTEPEAEKSWNDMLSSLGWK